jgi:hypothetical protein
MVTNSSGRAHACDIRLQRRVGGLVTPSNKAQFSLRSKVLDATDPGKLGRAAFVSVVESTNFGLLYHRTEFGRLNRPRDWRILF